MSQSNVGGWRRIFLAAGVVAGLGLAAYAASFLFGLPNFSPTASFAPARMRSGEDWSALAQAIGLAVFTIALLPVAALLAARRFRENPYAAVIGIGFAALAVCLETVDNLATVAVRLYPGPLASVSADAALYAAQIDSIHAVTAQLAGLVCAFAAILVFGLMVRADRPSVLRLVLGSLVVFAVGAGFLALSPAVSLLMAAGGLLSMAPIPVALANAAAEAGATPEADASRGLYGR